MPEYRSDKKSDMKKLAGDIATIATAKAMSAAAATTYTLSCPHCGSQITVVVGENHCPFCKGSVTVSINLDD